ncbi:MAG: sulfatase [Sedimentisphaerales bacterium]|nr:sulfatase [Sedimentisphaerales bacterium]
MTRSGIAILIFSCAYIAVGSEVGTRPNVLLIISDDLRAELGCYAGMARTPNLDRLASAGVWFDRAYCQFPLCNPSRSSMLTGKHPTTIGILDNRTSFRQTRPGLVSMPQWFRQHGYLTFRAGKIFHGGIDDPCAWTQADQDDEDLAGPPARGSQWPPPGDAKLTKAQRSDRYLVLEGDGEGHPENAVAERTIGYLRQYKDRPFFIGCGFSKPHSPPTAPRRFYQWYDPNKIPLPVDFAPRPTVPEGFPRAAIRPRNADLFVNRDATEQEARQMIRAYLASVSWMDWNTGRVIAELDRLGLRQKTIIVFWGDNGYQLGEKGKWSKAGSLFEQGARVPLIIFAPGLAGNDRVCYRIVQSVDIFPTLVQLCGLPMPQGLEGRSLVPLLKDPGAAWDHPAFTVWSEDGTSLWAVAVRAGRWRYAQFQAGGAMLFDEQTDPLELKNLANDPNYASICEDLSGLAAEYASSLAGRQ